MVDVLACDCGDCTHWEVIMLEDDSQILKCKSCGHEFEATVDVAPHSKIITISRTEA